MVEVLVEHDYISKEPNELTIIKGDIIKDVTRKQGGWWEGTLKDKKGLFPDNFVRIVNKEASVVMRNKKDVARIRQCRVVFSYKQDHEDELNLSVGEVIEILGEEEEGWWRGCLNGKQGVFPSNFVEEIVPSKSKNSSRENLADLITSNIREVTSNIRDVVVPSLPSKPSKIICEVKFSYKAQNEDELSLKEGDRVTLLSKDGQDPGWWKGELNGVVGVFPDNFVNVLPASGERPPKDDKKEKSTLTTVTSQRKSLEVQNDKAEVPDGGSAKTTPPVPGKKPALVKKSPSSSGTAGGLFSGLKKKLVDAVDGATGSKAASPPKNDCENVAENVFDDVVRRPLLTDVRASRPKAPGRRPPSALIKESDQEIMNGNSDHALLLDTSTGSETTDPNPISSPEIDSTDSGKPKLREWEKHKAPWLAEMKKNQAKRTSTSPGPEPKLKLTPTEKGSLESEDSKPAKKDSPVEPKPAFAARLKTPPSSETPMLRNKPAVSLPARPQTIQSFNNIAEGKPPAPFQKAPPSSLKVSGKTEKISELGVSNSDCLETAEQKNYLELVERIGKLEEMLERQHQEHELAIERLQGKLEIETEMRMELEVKIENLMAGSAVEQI